MILTFISIIGLGCSVLVKRSSFVADDKQGPSIQKFCEKPGVFGERIRVLFEDEKGFDISIRFEEGPIWGGPLLVPIIPFRISDDISVIGVQVSNVSEGIKFNTCNWTVSINSLSERLGNLNKGNSVTCDSQWAVFLNKKEVEVESVTVQFSEVLINGGVQSIEPVTFNKKTSWSYHPIFLMADQLSPGAKPYPCEQ